MQKTDDSSGWATPRGIWAHLKWEETHSGRHACATQAGEKWENTNWRRTSQPDRECVCVCLFVLVEMCVLEGGLKMDALEHGESGVLFCQPERYDTGPTAVPGWGFAHRDNSSQATVMAEKKVLQSACEWAAGWLRQHRTTTAHSSGWPLKNCSRCSLRLLVLYQTRFIKFQHQIWSVAPGCVTIMCHQSLILQTNYYKLNMFVIIVEGMWWSCLISFTFLRQLCFRNCENRTNSSGVKGHFISTLHEWRITET